MEQGAAHQKELKLNYKGMNKRKGHVRVLIYKIATVHVIDIDELVRMM